MGDTHASGFVPLKVKDLVEKYTIEEVWSVGDFGWWPRNEFAKSFLARMNDVGCRVYFIDGNHEDHSDLSHDTITEVGYVVDYETYPNIIHCPRGWLRTVGGRKVLHIGGAHSVDKYSRREGVSWFTNEAPNYKEMGRAFNRPTPDIVLSHEIPEGVDVQYYGNWPKELTDLGEGLRRTLGLLLKHHKPAIWFAGHHHQRITDVVDTTVVHVLNSDASPGTFVLLDLDTLEVTDLK